MSEPAVIDQLILRLLDRRGAWMSAIEIFDASPDYPEGDYVLADIKTLVANRLIVPRRRQGSTITEYGLPTWINAPLPAPTFAYLAFLFRRLVRQLFAAA